MAEPSVITINAPDKTKKRTIGINHHFLQDKLHYCGKMLISREYTFSP